MTTFKIFDKESLKPISEKLKNEGKKIVFTNGCFDIIHLGHIDYLTKSSNLGDFLIVGINTDNSIRDLKGNNRPFQDELSRAMIMSSFYFVDAVILFDESTPYELIDFIKPDVLVKGGDYDVKNIIGNDIVSSYGGIVKTIDFLEGYSTSLIEKKIKI